MASHSKPYYLNSGKSLTVESTYVNQPEHSYRSEKQGLEAFVSISGMRPVAQIAPLLHSAYELSGHADKEKLPSVAGRQNTSSKSASVPKN